MGFRTCKYTDTSTVWGQNKQGTERQRDMYVHAYYISVAILCYLREMKMVLSLGKIFLSDEEIILFERYNAPWFD